MRPYLQEPSNNLPRQCSSMQNVSVLWLIVYFSAAFYQKQCATVTPARHHWLVVAFGPCPCSDTEMLRCFNLPLACHSPLPPTQVPPSPLASVMYLQLSLNPGVPHPPQPPTLPNPEQWCATVRLRLTTGTTSITIFARLLQVCDLFHFISSTHFTFKKVIFRYVQKFLVLTKHLIYKSKLRYNPL